MGADYQTLVYEIKEKTDKTVKEVLEENGVSARLLRKAKRDKTIFVNGNKISLNAKVRLGDIIVLKMIEDEHQIGAENIAVEVLYEDMDIVAVNKEYGFVSHPTAGTPTGTLSNALRYYGLSKNEDYKPRLINRLDRDTSGIILFAKNPYAQARVSACFQAGKSEKYYQALVHGIVKEDAGEIEAPIARLETSLIERGVVSGGQYALTKFWVLERGNNYTRLKLKLETGRTHQIRVHLAHIGHRIIGDSLYGSPEKVAIKRQALHAAEISFDTPRNGRVTIQSELARDIQRAIRILDRR